MLVSLRICLMTIRYSRVQLILRKLTIVCFSRLLDSYSRCQELGLVDRCHKIETRFASDEVRIDSFIRSHDAR